MVERYNLKEKEAWDFIRKCFERDELKLEGETFHNIIKPTDAFAEESVNDTWIKAGDGLREYYDKYNYIFGGYIAKDMSL